MMCFIFFFKQKTAYEMRISDWSSDVCSSDLISQTKAALYVTNGDPKTARDVFLGFALVQGGAVTTAFIGGRHGFTDEVFGQTDFFSERRFFVIAHTGINHGVLWQLATFDELCDSAPASAASVDVEHRFLVGSRADDDGLQKAICVDRDREGVDTDFRKRFSHIGRREAEFAEGNLLVLHDESPVTTETRFMGLTPRGPRPLPSPSPSIFGAPTVRQVGRGTRAIARGRYDPMAGPWLEA